jgi:hypothetical protein
MVGDFIWTEAMVSEDMRRQRSVGLGSYSFDVHWVRALVVSMVPSLHHCLQTHIVCAGDAFRR